MARTIFDVKDLQDVSSDLPSGLYLLSATQVAFLLAMIGEKPIFRGNWEVDGEEPTDAEWDAIETFVSDTERSIMVPAAMLAGFRALKTSQQTLAPDTYTKITWQDTDFDINGDFDFANDRFVASVEGFYLFSALARMSESSEHGKNLTLNLEKNGSQITRAAVEVMAFGMTAFIYVVVEMSAGDYVELRGQQNSTVSRATWAGIHTQFSGYFIGGG